MDYLIKSGGYLKTAGDDNGARDVLVMANTEVRDSHGDLMLPGSFEHKELTLMSKWGHQMYEQPVAYGPIHEDFPEVLFTIEEWEDSEAARVTKSLVRNPRLKDIIEVSYALQYLEWEDSDDEEALANYFMPWDVSRLFVYEVSPVNKGASYGTGIKAYKTDVGTKRNATDASQDDNAGRQSAKDEPTGGNQSDRNNGIEVQARQRLLVARAAVMTGGI